MNRFELCKRLLRGLAVLIAAGAAGLANAAVTVAPVTWNVVGLDSNNVSVGPNVFPVGGRICNTASTDIAAMKARFVWDTTSTYLAVSPSGSVDVPALSGYACQDVYFDVTVTRDSAAYDQTARYHLEVLDSTATNVLASTITPREIYVEHLISQNRNNIGAIRVDGNLVAPGGSYNVNVGETYTVTLVGHTATQGYEQFEQFLTLSATKFRVNSVTSTYTANAGTDPNATKQVYADGCGWVNDPTDSVDPSYRECTGTGKYGGDTTLTYSVTVLPAAASSTQQLSPMLYDFSGSSYHYNSDYGTAGINIVVAAAPSGSADLSIAKSVDNAAPTNGAPITFSLAVTNNGPDNATGVIVTDVVPAGYSLKPTGSWSVPGGTSVSVTGTTVTWTIGNLANGATVTLGMDVQAEATGPYLNSATVTGDQSDPNQANNTATKSIALTNLGADVAVSKVASSAFTQVGDAITFTITATNLGPGAATGVHVADLLPSGYALTGNTPSVGTYNTGTGDWNIGALALNASATLTLNATVNASGTYLNTATATTTSSDPNPANDTASANAEPSFLSITKTPVSQTMLAGGTGSFTLTVTKSGNPAALGTVTVQDVAPLGMTVTSMTGTGWTCTTAQCTRNDATAGTGAFPTITVNVSIASPAPATMTNFASVSAGNSYASATAVVTSSTTSADLSVVKTVNSPTPTVGSNVTFTIAVTNNGPNAATNVAVADVLPSGYQFVSATPGTGSYASGVWTIGNLANGGTASMTIVATVLGSGTYLNTATVSATEADTNAGNNTSSATTTPTLAPPPRPGSVQPIPTLSEWGMIILSSLLAVGAAVTLRRRQY